MDIYSLVAANIRKDVDRAPMCAKSEDRYYWDHVAVLRLTPRLLGPIVVTCAILIVVGIVPI